MEITEKQRYDLNNRNVASQNVKLGDIILNEGGDTLTFEQVEAMDNDNVVTQEVRLGHILKAICAGDTSSIPDLTDEQIDRLNNMDVACQNCQLGTLIQAILDGTQKFVLTLEFDHEMGTVSGAGRYIENASVTISATANYGYKFVEWQDENAQTVSTSAQYTFTMPAHALTYTAVFESVPMYTLTVNSNNEEYGSVTGSGNYTVGTEVTLTATTNLPHAEFVNWTINGAEVSTDNPFVYTTTDSAITIVGNFTSGSPILGVSGLYNSFPVLQRTDDAVGMSYSINSENGEVTSDFDDVFPFSDFVEETDNDGNVFVSVPSMWFRIGTSGNVITDIAVSEQKGVGDNWYQTKAFKYGKYGASGTASILMSKSGQQRLYSLTREDARTRAMAVGTGYHQRDLYASTVLSFLWLIEFATKNSQSIMRGCQYGVATGGTNAIATPSGYNITTDQMKWHGIEDFIGNGYEFEDGITGNGVAGSTQYVSDDYTLYDDYDEGTAMTALSFNSPSTQGQCLAALGWDANNPFLIQPYETVENSNYDTYFCDDTAVTNNVVAYRGSGYPQGGYSGIFAFGRGVIDVTYGSCGCRLMKEETLQNL